MLRGYEEQDEEKAEVFEYMKKVVTLAHPSYASAGNSLRHAGSPLLPFRGSRTLAHMPAAPFFDLTSPPHQT